MSLPRLVGNGGPEQPPISRRDVPRRTRRQDSQVFNNAARMAWTSGFIETAGPIVSDYMGARIVGFNAKAKERFCLYRPNIGRRTFLKTKRSGLTAVTPGLSTSTIFAATASYAGRGAMLPFTTRIFRRPG